MNHLIEPLSELQQLISRHCNAGRVVTKIPRVSLVRADAPSIPVQVLYQPLLCVIAQGSKRAMLGDAVFEYNAAQYLVVSLDLPVSGAVHEASPEKPYLAFALSLDPAMLASMLLEMSERADYASPTAAMAVSPITSELLDPVVRLLRLLDEPRDIAMLAPLLEREILYRLLTGEQGAMLRQIALADSRVSQVSRATDWIRRNYSQPFSMETLAQVASMSSSSLHRHFKAVTNLSPLQYQKQIRLQEARARLLSQQGDAATIGLAVGYESPSQFGREYSRLFGAPPGRDAARLRGTPVAEAV